MDSEWAEKFKVLADPTRLSVIGLLLEAPHCVNDLCRLLAVEQTLMSHHLRILRQSGFVEAERDGKSVNYSLAPGLNCSVEGRALDLGCCRIAFQPAPKRPTDV